MFESIVSLLHALLALLGAAGPVDPSALGLAVAVVATVVAVTVLLSVVSPRAAASAGPHPHRAIDLSSPLLQSDPDAPGHPRPRAPGVVASAAA
jgi:hypothetical protein